MPTNIDIRQSGLYREGFAVGFAEGKAEYILEAVQELLHIGKSSDEGIMKILNITLEDFESIKNKLSSETNPPSAM
jgi:DNA-directed RNA polymerase subunit F